MKTFIPPQLKGNIKPRDISHIRVSVNTHTRVLTNTHIRVLTNTLIRVLTTGIQEIRIGSVIRVYNIKKQYEKKGVFLFITYVGCS